MTLTESTTNVEGNGRNHQKKKYIQVESLFKGNIGYCNDTPTDTSQQYEIFECRVPLKRMIRYQPKLCDIVSSYQSFGVSEVGPLPDLIYPHITYTPSSQRLCHQDALLVEDLLKSTKKSSQESFSGFKELKEKKIASIIKSPSTTTVLNQTSFQFIHPIHSHLKPRQVFSILPHSSIQETEYINITFNNSTILQSFPRSKPYFILKRNQSVLKKKDVIDYTLYVKKQEHDNNEGTNELVDQGNFQTKTFNDDSQYTFMLCIPDEMFQRQNSREMPILSKDSVVSEKPYLYIKPLLKKKVSLSKSTEEI